MLALYNPRSSAGRKPVLPMSLLAIGALLDEAGIDYRVVDGNLVDDPLRTLEHLIADGVDLLGVTVMPGPQLQDALPLCRELKSRHPGLTIVWGGYFPTQHADVCLRSGYVDHVVRGHGEFAFRELVQRLRRGDGTAGVTGVVGRGDLSGEVLPPPAPVPHPDELPDFPYERLEVERYVRPTFMGERTLPHHSSYGCPFRCNFCAVVNMVDGAWKAQSATRTATVVHHLVDRYGVDAVEFYDNNFFTHEARTAEFAGRIRHLGLGWWGEARIDTLLGYRETTWQLLRDSGLRMVFLGAESGSDDTLARMNKGGTASAAKTLEIVTRMREYGIVPELSFVVGNPPDPEADTEATIALIRRVKELHPGTEIVLYAYTPVPLAGELYEQARAAGFAFPQTLEEWASPGWLELIQRRAAHLPWIDDDLRTRLRDFEWVLNARYPTTTNRDLGPLAKGLLRAAGSWRYRYGRYRHPIELRALHRVVRYRRPETAGF